MLTKITLIHNKHQAIKSPEWIKIQVDPLIHNYNCMATQPSTTQFKIPLTNNLCPLLIQEAIFAPSDFQTQDK